MADNGVVVPITGDSSGLEAALNKSTGKLNDFASKAEGFFGKMQTSSGRATLAMAAYGSAVVAGTAAVAGLVAVGFRYAEQIDAISDQTGAAASEIISLTKAANDAGVSSDNLTQSLSSMSVNIGSLMQGSEEAAKKFAKIGLTAKELEGLNLEQQFALIAESISGLSSANERAAVTSEIFGKTGKKLQEMFNGAAESIGKYKDEVSDNVLNRSVKEVDELGKRMGELWSGTKDVALQAAGGFSWLGTKIYDAGKFVATYGDTQKKVNPIIDVGNKVTGERIKLLQQQAIDQEEVNRVSEAYIKTEEQRIQKMLAAADAMHGSAESAMETSSDDPAEKRRDKALKLAAELDQVEGSADEMSAAREKAAQVRKDAQLIFDIERAEQWKKYDEAQAKDAVDNAKEMADGRQAAWDKESAANDARDKKQEEVLKKLMDYEFQYADATADAVKERELLLNHEAEYKDMLLAQEATRHEKFLAEKEAREKQFHDNMIEQKTLAEEEKYNIENSYAEMTATDIAKKKAEYARADYEQQQHGLILWEAGERGKLQLAHEFLDTMGTMMESKNKQMFQVGKAAAIANTIISTYEGAQKAFTSFAALGPWGVAAGTAAAAAAVAAGIARVQKIQSTQFNGGGGGSGGGGGGSSNFGGPGGQALNNPQQNTSTVNVSLYGESFSAKQVQSLVGLINSKAVDNNMNLRTQVSSGYSS